MIATTIEQSYELLEAGLSPESADMHYTSRKQEKDADGKWRMVLGDLCVGKCETGNDLPAWSCARLIEINEGIIDSAYKSDEIIQNLVTDTKNLLKMDVIDAKYLKK